VASSELTGLNRRYALRRIEAKFRHLGVAKQRIEANRRSAHLHVPQALHEPR